VLTRIALWYLCAGLISLIKASCGPAARYLRRYPDWVLGSDAPGPCSWLRYTDACDSATHPDHNLVSWLAITTFLQQTIHTEIPVRLGSFALWVGEYDWRLILESLVSSQQKPLDKFLRPLR
jgi:hypothetical protein